VALDDALDSREILECIDVLRVVLLVREQGLNLCFWGERAREEAGV
jgi:hypothetical protein